MGPQPIENPPVKANIDIIPESPVATSALPKKSTWWKWVIAFIIILFVISFLPLPTYMQPTCKPGQINCPKYLAWGPSLFDRLADLLMSRVTDTPIKIPSNLENPSETLDETADWKTYTSEAFSFKYPDYFSDIKLINQAYGENAPLPAYVTTYLDPNQHGGGPGYTVSLQLGGPEVNPDKLNITEWLTKSGRDAFVSYGEKLPTTKETKEIDGTTMVLLTENNTSPREFAIYFSIDTNVYFLRYSIASTVDEVNRYQTDFDKILSTFQFTEQNTSAPADWTTYNDPFYKYSIKYPSNLTVTPTPSENGGTAQLSGQNGGKSIYLEIGNGSFFSQPLNLPIVESNVVLGKIAAKRQIYQANSNKHGVLYLFSTNNRSYFAEYYTDDYQQKDEQTYYEQILSTFKFL